MSDQNKVHSSIFVFHKKLIIWVYQHCFNCKKISDFNRICILKDIEQQFEELRKRNL